jgi:hypothetical protein
VADQPDPAAVQGLWARIRGLLTAIDDGDDDMVQRAVLELSQSRRFLAPLAFLVGAFAMLFEGVKLLVSNWRLTLIQIVPAMWIWLAMFDLKAHAFRGKTFHVLHGPALGLAVALIVAITAVSFYLNAVFAFAIAKPGPPEIRPAFADARRHLRVVLGWGGLIGVALALATVVLPRWRHWAFFLVLSVVVAVMMFAYVAVPSRLIGVRSTGFSKRDKLSAAAVGGAIGAVICTPPYALGRLAILMLGTHWFFIPGVILLTLAITVQAGATGAVKAIKMSAKLVAGRDPTGGPDPDDGPESG